MAKVNFSIIPSGYSPDEVDRYIELLQQEYQNAVAWGEEMEAKFNELENSMKELGVYFTIDENNRDQVIAEVFARLTDAVNKGKAAAEKQAEGIIAKANEKGRAIVRQAMENSVELRTKNNEIVENLKSVSEMINKIIESESGIQ